MGKEKVYDGYRAYGYLELDLVTGGAYRRRLRWAALGVLLLLAGAGVCVWLFASQSAVSVAPIV